MDREQVLQLYDAYSDDVYRLAYSYLLDPHNAQDAVQEVFLRLLERPCAIRPGKERAFLARVTANYCKDCLRRAKRRPPPPENAAEPAEPDPAPGRAELRAALGSLTPAARAAVYLHYYAGYSAVQIARILGVTPSGVWMRLNRARAQLRAQLKEENPDENDVSTHDV